MAGTAQLNVVLKIVSKFKDDIPGISQDAKKVAAVIKDILKTPESAGAGFASLFDFSGKDVAAQIKIIQQAIEVLQVKLANSDIRKSLKIKTSDADEILGSLKQLGADAVRSILPLEDFQKKISDFFDLKRVGQDVQAEGEELKKILKTLNIAGALTPPPGSEKSTMAAWGQAIRRRKEAAQELVESTKQSESAQTTILLKEIDNRIAAKKKEVEELFHLQSQAISKFESAQKGGAIRSEAKEEVKGLRKRVDEELILLKNLEDTREELAKRGADAAIQESKRAGEAERKESKKTADTVVEDAKKAADAKADIKAKPAKDVSLIANEQVVAEQLLDLWKAYSQQRIKIQDSMVDAIVASETAGARKIIDNWEQVAKNIASALPVGSKKQVIIEIKGALSPPMPLSEAVTKTNALLAKIDTEIQVNVQLGNVAKLKELREQLPAITKEAVAMHNRINAEAKELGKFNTRGQFDGMIEGLKTNLTKISENRQKSVDLYVKSSTAINDIESKAAAERVKVATTGEELVAAAAKLRVDVHRVSADKRLGIERELFYKIADIYQGRMKTDVELKRQEIESYRKTWTEKLSIAKTNLEHEKGLLAKAAFNKVQSGGSNRFDDSINIGIANVAKYSAEVAKLGKNIQTALNHEYTIKVLLEASPAVPFSAGIANIKRLLSGLPTESEFKVKVIGLEVETAKFKKLQDTLLEAENRLAAARERRANAGTDVEKRSANAQIASLTAQVNRHRKAANEQELAVALMYDHTNDMAVDAYAKSGKLRKAETDAYVEDEKRKTQAVKEENRKRGDAVADLVAQGRGAQLAARKALDDALATGQSKGSVKDIGSSYNIISAEVKKLVGMQNSANRAMKAGNKEVADQLKGEMVQALKRVEDETTKLGLDFKQVMGANLNASKMWEDRMTSWSYRFSHVGMQLGMFGAAASAAFLGPVVAVKDFQKSLEYTNAILGGNEQSLKRLRDTAMEVGTSTIYSTQQVADGLKTLAQAGLTANEAIQGVKPILDFASSGMLNLDDAARIAISTMNQFGLGLSDLPRLTNNIQAAANKTNAEVKDFGESLKNVGPTAKAVGASLEETTTALGLLTQAGLKGSMAGTQLRGIYRKLLEASNDGSRAGKIFKNLGLSVVDAAGNFKDLQVIIEEFKTATADMTEVERAAKVYEIFGQRAGGPAVLALLNAGGEAWKNLGKTIADAADSAQIAKDRGEGLWGALEKLKNSFTGLIQTIGYSEGTFLRGLIDGLITLTNVVRTAIEQSPALKFLLNVFMGFTAIAAAVTLAGSAMAMLASNVLSLLGVSGPVKALWDKLILTMRGYTAAQRESMLATKATTVAEGKQIIATNGLAASFTALSKAQKAILIFAAIMAAIEVGRAVYQFAKGISEVNDQIGTAENTWEKFKKSAEQPLTTKAEFALLSEDGKRKAIKHLVEFEQAYTAKIASLENQISKKKFWTFGIGNTKKLEEDLKNAQKKLAEGFSAEQWLRIRPSLDPNAIKKVKADSIKLIDETDLLFGNTKLGIDKFDIKKVVDGLQSARDKFYDFNQLVNGADLTINTEGLQTSLQEMDIQIADSYASRLQSVRNFNQEALDATTAYFEAAMEDTRNWQNEDKTINDEVVKQRESAYSDTLAALDDMYQEATTKMDKYSEEIIKAEQELAKTRVDAHNWYLDQIEVSDKLKTARRKQLESEEKMSSLKGLYSKQVADGDLKLAAKTHSEIKKLQEEINKGAREQLAETVKKGLEAENKLAENREKLADRRESRENKIAARSAQNAENDIRRTEQVASAEKRLSDLREKLSSASTEKERLSITQQIENAETRISELRRKDSAAGSRDQASLDRLSNETAAEKSLENQGEKLADNIAALNMLRKSGDETVKVAIQYGEELVKEKNTIEGTADLVSSIRDVKSDSKWIAEQEVALQEGNIGQLRAGLAIWKETAEKAKLTKAVVQTVYAGVSNIDLSKDISQQLKDLKNKFEKDGITVTLKTKAKDKATLEVLELATGKKSEIDIPINVSGGEEVAKLDAMVKGVQKTVDVTANVKVTTDKANDAVASAAKKTGAEFVQIVRKYIDKDGKEATSAFWTNFVEPGEKIVNKITLFDKVASKAEDAGKNAGQAMASGINEEGIKSTEVIVSKIEALPGSIAATFGTVGETIKTTFTEVGTSLQLAIQQASDQTKTAVQANTEEMFTNTKEGLRDLSQDQIASQKTAAEQSAQAWTDFTILFKKIFSENNEMIVRTYQTSHKTAVEDAQTRWQKFFSDMSGWIDKLKDAWNKLFGKTPKTPDVAGAGNTNDTSAKGGRFGGLVGFARGMAEGGHIPGYGGGDRHPVLLESGEYVLPKEMVKGIGVQTLNSMRALFLKGLGLPSFSVGVPRMAKGGLVTPGNATDSTMGTYTLNLNLGGTQYPLMGKRDVIDTLIDAMRKEGLTKR